MPTGNAARKDSGALREYLLLLVLLGHDEGSVVRPALGELTCKPDLDPVFLLTELQWSE